MTESQAWLTQVDSDWETAELLFARRKPSLYCQEISKYQQVVEKAIKTIDSIVREKELLRGRVRGGHYPVRMIERLIRLPVGRGDGVSAHITNRIFARLWQTEIRDLCLLAPTLPEAGELHIRNTEYPYNERQIAEWTAPAADNSFSIDTAERFDASPVIFVRGRTTSSAF